MATGRTQVTTPQPVDQQVFGFTPSDGRSEMSTTDPPARQGDRPQDTVARGGGQAPGGAKASGGVRRQTVTAETLAKQQREISVSEFFAKNRHLLGFDNKRKALLTTVQQPVHNNLDPSQ